MPTHAEKRPLPYTPEQLYDLVADIEKYPQFLPWCLATRIRRRDGNVVWADMAVGFKMIREKFTSRVKMSPKDRIDVAYSDGPFKYLNNHWVFEDAGDGTTIIDFYVDFEFRSPLLQKVMGAVFSEAVRVMVSSFEKRARQLYGPPGSARAATATTAGATGTSRAARGRVRTGLRDAPPPKAPVTPPPPGSAPGSTEDPSGAE